MGALTPDKNSASIPTYRKRIDFEGIAYVYDACPSYFISEKINNLLKRYDYEKKFNKMPDFDNISAYYYEFVTLYEKYYAEYKGFVNVE